MSKEPWFEGSRNGRFPLAVIDTGLSDPGQFFAETTGLMAGVSSARLIGQQDGSVDIETNEGRMARTNVVVTRGDAEISVEFDETYQAGKLVTGQSHHLHRFVEASEGTVCHVKITDVKAPGVLGFFYRIFAAKNIGSAFLTAYEIYGAAHCGK